MDIVLLINVSENREGKLRIDNPETLVTLYTLRFRKIEEIFNINKVVNCQKLVPLIVKKKKEKKKPQYLKGYCLPAA